MDYIQSLQREGRSDEVPRYVMLSDFARFAIYDLEEDTSVEFPIGEFHKNVRLFGFIPGYKQHKLQSEDPINLKAVQIMGDLHDALEAGGYVGHDLERMLVRVLFCLFAEDTGIFERNAFELFILNHTSEDGSNLGSQLAQLFHVLNTPNAKRQSHLLEELSELPYVNGDLFGESLGFAAFNRHMRDRLLACTRFDWSRISPAVFGALFQAVMLPAERRQIGAHYTSERDILKVIRPLFLDELYESLDKAGQNKSKLRLLQRRLNGIRLLDPACGCGNFLVISYRELRLVELEILKRLETEGDTAAIVDSISMVDVDQMYGIEIEEWPARIAEVAMWLMDHQMNLRLSEQFGTYFVRLPLKKSPHIVHGNALRIDWNEVLPASQCTYVLGNPPFVGKKEQTSNQKGELKASWGNLNGVGNLDYVTCWYVKAARYIQNSSIVVAFVSTNSISQGEQVATIWRGLEKVGPLFIRFAHRTFAWKSEAKGKAHVHVVIIGFSATDTASKTIFEYENIQADPLATKSRKINGYLVDAPDVFIGTRTKAINGARRIFYGSMMIDKPRSAGDSEGFIVSSETKETLVADCPSLLPYIRPALGGEEFINGTPKWCLWLEGVNPELLRSSRLLSERISKIKKFRQSSSRPQTVALAATPYLFGERRQPNVSYLLIPKVSSMSRVYIPMGFVSPTVIATGSALTIPGAELFDFGILTSSIHNAWMRYVAGRMKSDYQYSANIVYNNFPWPENQTDSQKDTVKVAAQSVLDARSLYPESTLADLYDPLSMPTELRKAHDKLDRAVEKCYRSKPFPSERSRVEFLFELYQKLANPLVAKMEAKQRPKS